MRYIVELSGSNGEDQKWEATVTVEAIDAVAAMELVTPDMQSTCMTIVAVNPDDDEEEEGIDEGA